MCTFSETGVLSFGQTRPLKFEIQKFIGLAILLVCICALAFLAFTGVGKYENFQIARRHGAGNLTNDLYISTLLTPALGLHG